MERHPTTAHWSFPPEREPLPVPLDRTNLRELAARPDRFEHHLTIVGRMGVAQLEVVTASEPLFFAHQNVSDEYALALPTGDPMGDSFPFLTFFSNFDTGKDAGRVKHKVGQILLHPDGFLHWPGRLRPPYEPFAFAPGMRRCGLSMVFCAYERTPPENRPLFVSPGNDGATKQYTDEPVPFLLATIAEETTRTLGTVGTARLDLVVDPPMIAPKHGGYVVVYAASDNSGHFPGDLVYIPAGASLDGTGISRALVAYATDSDAESPPVSWSEVPPAPFTVNEDGLPGELPLSIGDMVIEAASDSTVQVRIGASELREVPRYWLARFMFRTALHQFQLGYLETYGGFYYSDVGGRLRLGLRDIGEVTVAMTDALATVERIYRAVAPAGYVERLT